MNPRLLSLGTALGALTLSLTAAAQDPLMWYSGTIVNACNNPIETGAERVAVTLWLHESGMVDGEGASLKACGQTYAEKYGGGAGDETELADVEITYGRFRVPLDADCNAAVRAHKDLWVQLEVAGVAFTPRTKVGAAPTAVRTGLNWVVTSDAAVDAQEDHGYVLTADNGPQTIMLAADCSPGAKIKVNGAGADPWNLLHPDSVVVFTPQFDTEIGSDSNFPTMGAIYTSAPRTRATFECVRAATALVPAAWSMSDVNSNLTKALEQTVFATNVNNVLSEATLAQRFDLNIQSPSYWGFVASGAGGWWGKDRYLTVNRNNNTNQLYSELVPRLDSTETAFSDNFEIAFQAQLGQTVNSSTRVILRIGGGAAFLQLFANGPHKVEFNDGTATVHSWAIPSNTVVRVRAQFYNGHYRIKYWLFNSSEPTTWNAGNAAPIAWTPPTPAPLTFRLYDYGDPLLGDVLIRRIGGFSDDPLGTNFPVTAETYTAP